MIKPVPLQFVRIHECKPLIKEDNVNQVKIYLRVFLSTFINFSLIYMVRMFEVTFL
jgi:hypothetical protein